MFEKNQKNEAVSTIKAANHAYADSLHEAAHHAGESVRGMLHSANNELNHAGDRVKYEIRNNPVRSTAIALGVGALLGLLIRR